MRKVEAPRANSLVHTHIALFTWARAALTLSSLEWGLEEDAAHGCFTVLTQPTTPSSAQTCFWILVMYTQSVRRFQTFYASLSAPPPPVSPTGCVGEAWPQFRKDLLAGWSGQALTVSGPLHPYEREE